MNAVCPTLPKLNLLLAGELAPSDETAVEEHIEHCKECQRSLVTLTADSDLAEQLTAANSANTEIPDSLRRRAAGVCADDGATVGQGEPTGGKSGPLVGDPPDVPGHDIQEVLGRGGLAVVYRAIHRQLHRTVALKVLRRQPSADERERLRREAGALAGLRHPNVVQIYEAGEVDGRPYLVLEYVAGGSLAKHVARRPLPPRDAASLMATVAAAAHAAHKNGLIHRDLKPANILLEWDGNQPSDDLSRCRPKLTDFGLVKDIVGDSDLTHKRDLIGTPAYMAPEQAAGRSDIGPAADIWAIGAVLYELLTGRPPFQGPTALDTLVQVRFTDPVPPSQMQPRIPRDIETICLKCLHKNPASRYATAMEVAADLNRWLGGRSIEARRTPRLVRAARWCKRNPPAAILGGIAASLLLAFAIGGPLVAIHQTHLRGEAAQRAVQAENERQRAGRNLDLAGQALDETMLRVYASLGIRPEVIYDFDRSVVRPAVPYLEEIVSQPASTPEQKVRQARAMRQLARALPMPRELSRAQKLFERANETMNGLVKTSPERRDYQRELALNHHEFGRLLLMMTQMRDEAEAELMRAIELQEKLVTSKPNDAEAREDLANTTAVLGERMARTPAKWKAAKPLLTRAVEIRHALRLENPGDATFAANEAFTRLWFGRVLLGLGEHAAAVEMLKDAIPAQKAAIALRPVDRDYQLVLARLEEQLGLCLEASGRMEEAKSHLDIGASIYDRLALAFPSSPEMIQAAALCHELYRGHLAARKDWAGAAKQARAGVAIIEQYCVAFPNNRLAQFNLVSLKCRLAAMLVSGSAKEADDACRSARKAADELCCIPGEEETRNMLVDSYVGLGEVILKSDASQALDLSNRAIELLSHTEIPTSNTKLFDVLSDRAQAVRAKALSALGRLEDTPGKREIPLGEKRVED